MAKKIKFPLKLADGTLARTLEELQEHFDLESVLEHYKSGKLIAWLRDRYFETEADAVEALDENAPDFQKALCEVFGVEFSGAAADMDEITRRQERLAQLRQFTDEDEFIRNIDAVAFDQEELADLLDEDCEKIYLCGERFTVPASRKGVTYVGVNSPTVHISGKVPDKAEDIGIQLVGVNCDNLPVAEGKEAESEPEIFAGGHSDDIPEEVADSIYQKLRGLCFQVDYTETDDYFVYYERGSLFGLEKIELGFYTIDKLTGKKTLVLPKSEFSHIDPDLLIDRPCFQNKIISKSLDNKVLVLDIENKTVIQTNIKQDYQAIVYNGKYIVLEESGMQRVACIDIEKQRKYSLKNSCSGKVLACNSDAVYFITSIYKAGYKLVEFSFISKSEKILTAVPNYAYSMAVYGNKLFLMFSTDSYGDSNQFEHFEIGYVDLCASSNYKYQTVCRVNLYRDPIIKRYDSGWLFVACDNFSLTKFDFQTMELTKLAEDCGYSEWNSGSLFSRGYRSYYTNFFVKIGEWVYFKQGSENTDAKVSINHPMSVEVLGSAL